MYTDTLAREQAVRAVLASPDPLPTILADIRSVVADYVSIVRHYPASGYSDNALWNAGRLLLDAYTKFGQPQDKDAGAKLLKKLVEAYPSSSLVKQVPSALASADAAAQPPVAQSFRPTSTSPQIATIRAIRRSVLPGSIRITIELDA
jgi:hypothetical protein